MSDLITNNTVVIYLFLSIKYIQTVRITDNDVIISDWKIFLGRLSGLPVYSASPGANVKLLSLFLWYASCCVLFTKSYNLGQTHNWLFVVRLSQIISFRTVTVTIVLYFVALQLYTINLMPKKSRI
jgi:hypothetical protein